MSLDVYLSILVPLLRTAREGSGPVSHKHLAPNGVKTKRVLPRFLQLCEGPLIHPLFLLFAPLPTAPAS
jgi:hypothetical protein